MTKPKGDSWLTLEEILAALEATAREEAEALELLLRQ